MAASEKFLEAIKYDGLPVNKPIMLDEVNRLPYLALAPLEDPDDLIDDVGILLSDKTDICFKHDFLVEIPTSTSVAFFAACVNAWSKISNPFSSGNPKFKTGLFPF